MKYTLHNLEETQKVAHGFVSELLPNPNSATIVGLYGDLGAGKTTFTQSAALALGITETVVSPTFVIEKIYEVYQNKEQNTTFRGAGQYTHFIHIDAYRLEKSEELLRLGWKEIIADPHNLIFIEWPERVASVMPEHIHLNFSHVSEEVRELEIHTIAI